MVNISALNNISQLKINTSSLNNTENVSQELINRANEESDGYLGLFILLPLFIVLLYYFSKDDGFFRLDFAAAGTAASAICLTLGFILVVSGLITSYRQVVWFAVIFAGFASTALFIRQ